MHRTINTTAAVFVAAAVALAAGSPIDFDARAALASPVAKRAPHPAQLIEPIQGQTLTNGGSLQVHFIDGETTASAIQLALRNASSSHTLSPLSVPFQSFHANATVTVSSELGLSDGAYDFLVLENDSLDPSAFAVEAASVPITLASGVAPYDVKRAPQPTEITSPAAGSTLTPGASFQFSFRDGETTADSVKVLLRAQDGSETVLATLEFQSFTAGAELTVPSGLPGGSYTLVVQENASFQEATYTDAATESVVVGSGTASAAASSPWTSSAFTPPSSASYPPGSSGPGASSGSYPSTSQQAGPSSSAAGAESASSGGGPASTSTSASASASASASGLPPPSAANPPASAPPPSRSASASASPPPPSSSSSGAGAAAPRPSSTSGAPPAAVMGAAMTGTLALALALASAACLVPSLI